MASRYGPRAAGIASYIKPSRIVYLNTTLSLLTRHRLFTYLCSPHLLPSFSSHNSDAPGIVAGHSGRCFQRLLTSHVLIMIVSWEEAEGIAEGTLIAH